MKKPKAAKPAPPEPERKPILGVDVKGELQDVEIHLIDEPAGLSDRLPRLGDAEAVTQLARSMNECGQLQPVMLERKDGGRFARVFGRRRLAAAKELGWRSVRAVVVPTLTPDVRRTVVAVENVQRQDLTPAEEILAVYELLQLQALPAARQLAKPLGPECGVWAGRTVSEATAFVDPVGNVKDRFVSDALLDHRVRGLACELVAAMLGKPASWVRDRLYISRLSEKARRLVLEGKLPLAHAREISKVADEKLRDRLAHDYAAGGPDSVGDTEAGSLEDLQEEVRRQVFSLHVVPWNRAVPFAGKPACEGCPHNSMTNPGLFEHGGQVSLQMVGGRGTSSGGDALAAKPAESGICTLAPCYAVKLRAAKAAVSATAKKIAARQLSKKKTTGDPVKVPAYIDRAALDRRVRQVREMWRGASKPVKNTKHDAEGAARREAKDRAENQLRDARHKRVKDFEKLLAGKLKTKPGWWVVYHLFTESKIYQATQGGQPKAVERVLKSPEFAAALKAAANPSWESVLTLEKTCGRNFDLVDTWYDAKSGVLDHIAEALGIEISPAPTLEQFLPKSVNPAASKPITNKPAAKAAR